MNIVICTTPIRPVPTNYPPFGSLAVIQSLRQAGYDPYFYDIDALRPSFEEVVEFFRARRPDVLGISAVVSTAYDYAKKLSRAVKRVSPRTRIVLGGNLAASAELLHRFAPIDYCVVGEGERVAVRLVRYLEEHRASDDYEALKAIEGITFLDPKGEMAFTGYDVAIPANEFLDPDFSILEQYSRIDRFVVDLDSDDDWRNYFEHDARARLPRFRGTKFSTIISAKGCVARCTFCHRWDKGYRHWPVDRIIGNMRYLMDRYDVAFFNFGDENFGSDRRKLLELLPRIKELDVLFMVAGVRVNTVTPELLHMLRDSGCVSIHYGMETGSPDVLKVMEKNTTLQQNIDASRWTFDAGLFTIYQFVLGMPAESPRTIAETIEFAKTVTEYRERPPKELMSMNYVQALPGTPVYEHARQAGLLGSTLEAEDAYLTSISDTNATDDTKFINYTDYPYLTVQSWRPLMLFEVSHHYYRNRRFGSVLMETMRSVFGAWRARDTASMDYSRGGYFNLASIRSLRNHPLFLKLFYPVRHVAIMMYVIAHNLYAQPPGAAARVVWEYFSFPFRRRRATIQQAKSLRRVVDEKMLPVLRLTEVSMLPLRKGR